VKAQLQVEMSKPTKPGEEMQAEWVAGYARWIAK